ncbi:MAG: tRNA-dihydrouridine synthase family protein [Candidatus Woesearchaeota archaeon]|nr:tRNA-dihydrouridine synthase family protein [Nanoarchaeota archaeon]USN44816.1 MAG: tRNA-dihydrouridine synthase family protein [Candidatus Woesearchaeota archaeon]
MKKLIRKNPFVLAPMDAVTDIAFRELCEECGCSYSTTELTSVEALVRTFVPLHRYGRGRLKINSVQLFGSKAEQFVEAARIVADEADCIDVNFGCPSATVTRNEAGSMLLKDPKQVGKIIDALVKHSDKPITAKIRLGYKKKSYLEVAKEIEDAGASLIAVHGRTAEQKYSGKANWDAIKEVHETVNIPVVGNGDISRVEQIDEYLGSHASALMIGRAAIGNPLIFEEFSHYYKKKEKLIIPDKKEKQKQLFMLYLKKLQDYELHEVHIRVQRQAMWFFKGIEGAKELRVRLMACKTIEDLLACVEEF